MYEGYTTFGGVEVVNNERAYALAREAHAMGFMRRVAGLANALQEFPNDSGAEAGFGDIENAPWWDPDRAEVCERFFGLYGLRLDGAYDSTRQVTVTQNSGDGGVIGAPRKATRGLRARATMIARGLDAMEYGRAWLESVLSLNGCSQDEDCGRADVLFFADVPTDPTEALARSRFLKYAATTSGPFVVEEYVVRGVYITELEWTWTSEKPFIYGAARAVELDLAQSLQLIQDVPINWVPYPSAELSDGTAPLATNLSTNPGCEVDATGWDATATTVSGTSPAAYFTEGRVTADAISAFGTACYRARIAGNGSTSVATSSADLAITHLVSLTGVTAGHKVGAAFWAAAMVVAGTATAVTDFDVVAQWLNVSSVQVGADVVMTAYPGRRDSYEMDPVEIPATATQLRLKATARVSWGSGNTDAANSDVRLYADAANVYWLRGA